MPQNVSPSVFLTNLHLGSNNLSGRVPPGITQSSQLSKLDLSDNFMLTGTLPDMRCAVGCYHMCAFNKPSRPSVLDYRCAQACA
jgi:hypothetical protein